ncbi:MAG TPA: hypothetical protein VKB81_06340 [Nitrospira sp.]|nr:hypothetical protein [Nitrospira sp.]
MRVITFLKVNKSRKKVRRSTGKPKIRWTLLGLPASRPAKLTPSIDTIRREVSSLASRGLGKGVRAGATGQNIQEPESGGNSRNRVRTAQQ